MSSNFPITKQYVNEYSKSQESEIKKRLKNHGKYASGSLYNSIKVIPKETKNSFLVEYYMNEYGKFIDKGVKGSKQNRAGNTPYKYTNKMPPVKAFDKWVVKKGIAPRGENGKFLSRKSIKFAIARSIFLRGIVPTNFFTIPFKRTQKQFEKGIEKSMAKDLDNQAKKLNE